MDIKQAPFTDLVAMRDVLKHDKELRESRHESELNAALEAVEVEIQRRLGQVSRGASW